MKSRQIIWSKEWNQDSAMQLWRHCFEDLLDHIHTSADCKETKTLQLTTVVGESHITIVSVLSSPNCLQLSLKTE